MAHYGNQVLCAPDSIFDSLVITHGTGKFFTFSLCFVFAAHTFPHLDTLEETAFFSRPLLVCRPQSRPKLIDAPLQ